MTPSSPPRLVPQRYPDMMTTDRAQLDRLLSATVVAHISALVEGRAVSIPTAFTVIDDRLVIHGSTGSRWMRAIVESEVSVTITRVTGLVVARSMFESSMLYRSAMLFGRFTKVDSANAEGMLEKFTDRILPGRSGETRPSSRKELAATMLLEMPIREWSLRISEDMPEDELEDAAGDTWAGQIRFHQIRASAHPAPDLQSGIVVPPSVTSFLRNPGGIV